MGITLPGPSLAASCSVHIFQVAAVLPIFFTEKVCEICKSPDFQLKNLH